MDPEQNLFNRFTAEDQGMMESPHNTPAKKVRVCGIGSIKIFRDSFGNFLPCLNLEDAHHSMNNVQFMCSFHAQFKLLIFCLILDFQNTDEKNTPISEVRPRAGSLTEITSDKTEILKQLHMPRKISF